MTEYGLERKRLHSIKLANRLKELLHQRFRGLGDFVDKFLAPTFTSTSRCSLPLAPLSLASYSHVFKMTSSKIRLQGLLRNVYMVLSNWRIPFYLGIPFIQVYGTGWRERDTRKRELAETLSGNKPCILRVRAKYNSAANALLIDSIGRECGVETIALSPLLQAATQPVSHYKNVLYALLSLLTGGTLEYDEPRNTLTFASLHQALVCVKKVIGSERRRFSGPSLGAQLGGETLYLSILGEQVVKADILTVAPLKAKTGGPSLTLPRVIRDAEVRLPRAIAGEPRLRGSERTCMNSLILLVSEIALKDPDRHINTYAIVVDSNDVIDNQDVHGLIFYTMYYYVATLLSNRCAKLVRRELFSEIEGVISEINEPAFSPVHGNRHVAALVDGLLSLMREKYSCTIDDRHLSSFNPLKVIERTLGIDIKSGLARQSGRMLGDIVEPRKLGRLLAGRLCEPDNVDRFTCILPQLHVLRENLVRLKNALGHSSGHQELFRKLLCLRDLVDTKGGISSAVIAKYMKALELVGGAGSFSS